MTAHVNVDGETVLEATLVVPNVGPWWAELVFELAPEIEDGAAVTLGIGAVSLRGTVDPAHNGIFGQQRRSRIIGGGGGWGALLEPLAYHNDAGVTALVVAQDAARLAGETLSADFAPAANVVGVDYVREAGAASRVLEDVIGGVPWWVDFDGVTQVGERPSVDVDSDRYEVLEVDPREKLARVALEDVAAVPIGGVLSVGLDEPLTAREIQIRIDPESSRATVWGGGTAAGRGRLAGLLSDLVERVTARRLFGKYRYRVVQMSGDRVELQAVSSAAGLPDVLPVSQKPGVSGAHASLTGGSVVLVEFVEGDRTLPLVVAYAGKGEEGHAPEELDFSVTTTLRLGDDTAADPVALAPSIDSQFDDINQALDALAAAVPVANDGGAALQTAFTGVWGAGLPPKPASDVGADKVRAT